VKLNADNLKIIQLGITFADDNGNLVPGVATWQFNFEFDLSKDTYAQESIDLLVKAGIDFDKHSKKGINVKIFAEHLISSGLVLNEDIHWVSYHGAFDFGYLLRLLKNEELAIDEKSFLKELFTFFPNVYDVKHMTNDFSQLKGGLNKLADILEVERYGPQHQAGSDCLVTCIVFFKLKEAYFRNQLDDSHKNKLYQLGPEYRQNSDQSNLNMNRSNSNPHPNHNAHLGGMYGTNQGYYPQSSGLSTASTSKISDGYNFTNYNVSMYNFQIFQNVWPNNQQQQQQWKQPRPQMWEH